MQEVKKAQIMKCRQELSNILQALNSVMSMENIKQKTSMLNQIKEQLAKVKLELPLATDTSYSSKQLLQAFREVVEHYESCATEITELKQNKDQNIEIKMENLDLAEEIKKVEQENIVEANRLTQELISRQLHINNQLQSDSENLEKAIISSDTHICKSMNLVDNLASATREERINKELNSEIGGKVANKIMGKRVESKIAQVLGGWILNLLRKKHEKKLKEVRNMQ